MGTRDFYLAFIEVPPDTEEVEHPGVYVQVSGLVAMIEILEATECSDPHVAGHFRELREALQRGVSRAITATEAAREKRREQESDDG